MHGPGKSYRRGITLPELIKSPRKNADGGSPIFRWSLLLVLLAAPAAGQANADCSGWASREFWEEYQVGDVKRCIAANADIHARAKFGYTPLHFAAGWGHAEAVNALLAAGADIHARDEDGNTSLHSAAGWGHAEAVNDLLAAGADIHARAEGGWTPLHMAARQGKAETVNALVAAGADIRAQAADGSLPADLAEENDAVRGDPVYWKLNEGRYP